MLLVYPLTDRIRRFRAKNIGYIANILGSKSPDPIGEWVHFFRRFSPRPATEKYSAKRRVLER